MTQVKDFSQSSIYCSDQTFLSYLVECSKMHFADSALVVDTGQRAEWSSLYVQPLIWVVVSKSNPVQTV